VLGWFQFADNGWILNEQAKSNPHNPVTMRWLFGVKRRLVQKADILFDAS